MSNMEKYTNVFMEMFGKSAEEVRTLNYLDIPEWDSVGHMNLIAALEDVFGIMMDTDDIIDFESYEKGIEMMKKYQVDLEA